MWLFTRHGFFSVVRAGRSDAGQLMIRSRERRDLVNLLRFARGLSIKLTTPTIIATPANDYPYRVFVTEDEWPTLAATLAADVDYGNFKSEVARTDKAREHVYHNVWSVLWQAFLGRRPKTKR
jgi:hypothetical protein